MGADGACLLCPTILIAACGRAAPAAGTGRRPPRSRAGHRGLARQASRSPRDAGRWASRRHPWSSAASRGARSVATFCPPAAHTAPSPRRLPAPLTPRRRSALSAAVKKGATVVLPLSRWPRPSATFASKRSGRSTRPGRQAMAAHAWSARTRLAADGAGSRRAAEEAQADLIVANAALKAAQRSTRARVARRERAGALAINAPADAMLQACMPGPGQTVAAGAPLFDLVRLDTVWIRVPLYAGDVALVDRRSPARIVPVGPPGRSQARGTAGDRPTVCGPVHRRGRLVLCGRQIRRRAAPGQRVGVRVPLTSEAQSLVVPNAALLHDAYGGAWVYEARDANTSYVVACPWWISWTTSPSSTRGRRRARASSRPVRLNSSAPSSGPGSDAGAALPDARPPR